MSAVAYAGLDLRRQLRDKAGMFFIVVLPGFMYLVFGVGGDETAGSGNVAMYVTISMAAYGAVTATTSIAGAAAQEQRLGWGRQIALTPLTPLRFVLIKTGVALTVASVPVVLIYAIGAATGARGDLGDWLGSGLVILACSAMFAIYGLAVSLIFRGPNTAGISSGSVVVLAFLGNMFVPLSGLVLDIGRFTPLYGLSALAHYPLTQGVQPTGGTDELWWMIANIVAWTAIFTALAVWGVSRSRERQ